MPLSNVGKHVATRRENHRPAPEGTKKRAENLTAPWVTNVAHKITGMPRHSVRPERAPCRSSAPMSTVASAARSRPRPVRSTRLARPGMKRKGQHVERLGHTPRSQCCTRSLDRPLRRRECSKKTCYDVRRRFRRISLQSVLPLAHHSTKCP